MTLFEELKWRGLIHNITDEAVIDKINKGGLTFYVGTDPTGDSLHVGHLLVFIFAKRLEQAGHHPLILIGGATGCIGDPKPTAERKLLTKEQTDHNAKCLYEQAKRLFNCEMVNNYDWTHNIDILTFLRTYGKFFNVNYMINKETVKSRLDSGISYTEFSYQILQALDFEHLFKTKNCQLQIGGQDQWGNITAGIELIRKKTGKEAYGFTMPLLTKSDGTKFGKTNGKAIWLDREKTSPYEFYQYWRNIDDSSVYTVGCMLTYLPMEEVNRLASLKDEKINEAKKVLAYEITKLVHGEEEAKKAEEASNALFEGNGSVENMPRVKLSNPNCSLTEAMVECGICSSKSQAKTLISQGAISLNDEKISDISYVLSDKDFETENTILKKGKKIFYCLEK